MSINNLAACFSKYPKYRLAQAQEALFKQFINSWDEAKVFSKALRAELTMACPINIPAQVFTSADGASAKALITLDDGQQIETVLMKHADGHQTVCVSTQVGCPMGCAFCATGKLGLTRNLTAEEIFMQVLLFCRHTKQRVDNVVFMGMGEPFLNYAAVLKAIALLNSPDKLNISSRHISISTCGVIAGINKLAAEEFPVNLALSLHAPNAKLRSLLMPINKTQPLPEVLKALKAYILKTKRRVMLEYVLLKDINDQVAHAHELAQLLKTSLPKLFFVNLIIYNATGNFSATEPHQIQRFKNTLMQEGINVTQRYAFGRGIKGACGQLARDLPH